MLKIVFCSILIFSHAALAVPSERILSKVVGTVSDTVVTSREVQVNALIETVLYPKKGTHKVKKEDLDIVLGTKVFEGELSRVLLEWIVFFEAKSLGVAIVTETELMAAENTVQNFLKENQLQKWWERFDYKSADLRQLIERKLRSKKFIEFKSRASQVPVTDAEALRYFQKNRNKFGGGPYSRYRESIKSELGQEQADERLKSWFRVLQKKYDVRKTGQKLIL